MKKHYRITMDVSISDKARQKMRMFVVHKRGGASGSDDADVRDDELLVEMMANMVWLMCETDEVCFNEISSTFLGTSPETTNQGEEQ